MTQFEAVPVEFDLRPRRRRGGDRGLLAVVAAPLARPAVQTHGLDGVGLAEVVGERAMPLGSHRLEINPILGPPRSRERGTDAGHVDLEDVGVARLDRVVAPQALQLRVLLDGPTELRIATGQLHVADGLLVDREQADGRAVLRRHVGDGGAIGQRHVREAGAEELDELPDDSVVSEDFGDPQHEIGRGRTLGEAPDQSHADDLGNQHVAGLPQHDRLRLDAAHAPADDSKAIDHRGVAVGADEGVRIQPGAVVPDHLGEVLQVHLMHDARCRRHHAEVAQRRLPPLEELVALAIPIELEFAVDGEGHAGVERVDLHGVVDHQIARHQRIDLGGIASKGHHRRTHRREIHHAGNAGEVLQNDATGHEGDLLLAYVPAVVARECPHVLLGHHSAVEVPQAGLQQDLDADRQAVDVAKRLQGFESDDVAFAERRREAVAGGERIDDGHGRFLELGAMDGGPAVGGRSRRRSIVRSPTVYESRTRWRRVRGAAAPSIVLEASRRRGPRRQSRSRRRPRRSPNPAQ